MENQSITLTLTLTHDEAQELANHLNVSVKAQGLQAAASAMKFVNRMEEAAKEPKIESVKKEKTA